MILILDQLRQLRPSFIPWCKKTSHFPAQCSCPERPSIPITRFAALFKHLTIIIIFYFTKAELVDNYETTQTDREDNKRKSKVMNHTKYYTLSAQN